MRKVILAILATLSIALSVAFAPAAFAADPPVNPVQVDTRNGTQYFALQCDLPGTSARGRAIFSGFDVYGLDESSVDASLIKWQSLNTSGQQASWQPDQVNIRLYSQTSGAYDNWTVRGGDLNDGVTVPSLYTWDPDNKYTFYGQWSRITMRVQSLGGQVCYGGGSFFTGPNASQIL